MLPITVVVCTLNEEKNIEECLVSVLANKPAEVLIIDGSSKDSTVEIARKKSVRVEVCEKKGLAYQRHKGVELASQPYVAFIDADDVLDENALSISLKQLKEFSWKAIGIQSGAFAPTSYWERAMGFLDDNYHNIPGPTVMVGRPAMYERETLVNVGVDRDWGEGVGNEDTDLSIRYEQLNLGMGMGTGKSLRRHPASLRKSLETWIKYGKGDAKVSIKHPQKKCDMLGQVYKRYFGILTMHALKARGLRYIPFIWMMGLTRFLVAIWHLSFWPKKA